jgi:hypothetical protein
MRKLILFISLILISSLTIAQTHLVEDFGGGAFPPAGWTIDAYQTNWSANASNNAGGIAPEARFAWSNATGESRLISPPTDLTGVTDLKVEFKHMLDHFSGPYTIGVATRSGGGPWNTVWEIVNPNANAGPVSEFVTINNSNVGAPDFQICWFIIGYFYNLNYWYIDDIRLFTPFAHDVMVKEIPVEIQYVPGSSISPQAVIKNFGLNTETFDVSCEIKIAGSSVYSQTSAPITLIPDEEQTVTFPDYIAASANQSFELNVTTNLTGDMDPTNDTMTKWLNTYTTEREMVLLEIGTGTWCVYCPGAAMGADDLIHNGHDVAVLEHHSGDSFENTYSAARVAYYGISGFPTSVFDGVDYHVGGDANTSIYTTYLPMYEARKAINVAFDVGIFGTHAGGLDYNLNVLVDKMAVTIPSNWNNLVLHVALTESHIPFTWFIMDTLNFVTRLMMPDENGTSIDMIGNNSLQVDLNFSLDPAWGAQNCELVAFIQNLDNKDILQGSKVALEDLSPVPVELTSFTAEETSEGVELIWSTASEINNHGFEIEKSFDGENFFRAAFVQGAGTTTETKNYSYLDAIEYNGINTFYYRLRQVDYDGRSMYSEVLTVEFDVPKDFILHQNYPNPFNPSTTIKYAVPKKTLVSIKIYDLTGQEIASLVNEVKEAGTYELEFEAQNIASGVYIYRMIADDFSAVKKFNVLK